MGRVLGIGDDENPTPKRLERTPVPVVGLASRERVPRGASAAGIVERCAGRYRSVKSTSTESVDPGAPEPTL